MKRALLRVDILNDFMPTGTLPVPDGDGVVAPTNTLTSREDLYSLVVDIQDWHPAPHKSFAANHPGRQVNEVVDLHGTKQLLWPTHAVQNTRGADFHPELVRVFRGAPIPVVQKGTNVEVDSYSGFFDNDRKSETDLRAFLEKNEITHVDVVGLATDFCVAATALDAIALGYKTRVLTKACRGVGIYENDIENALAKIKAAGGEVVDSPVAEIAAEIQLSGPNLTGNKRGPDAPPPTKCVGPRGC